MVWCIPKPRWCTPLCRTSRAVPQPSPPRNVDGQPSQLVPTMIRRALEAPHRRHPLRFGLHALALAAIASVDGRKPFTMRRRAATRPRRGARRSPTMSAGTDRTAWAIRRRRSSATGRLSTASPLAMGRGEREKRENGRGGKSSYVENIRRVGT
jgi:hypothetical protein